MKIPPEARCLYQGILFDVYQWDQELYDGSKGTFEMVSRKPTVDIIATVDDKIIILMQKQPHRALYPSLPAGKININERPEIAAQRELLEETGYQFEKLCLLDEYFGGSKIYFHEYVYVARDCKQVAHQSLDAGEEIKVGFVSFEEFLQLVRNPFFAAPIPFKFAMYEALLDSDKKEALKQKIFFEC